MWRNIWFKTDKFELWQMNLVDIKVRIRKKAKPGKYHKDCLQS